jgi:hypothetical protein
MTRIQGDRMPLDELLSGIVGGTPITDVLLLRGAAGSDAERAYERALAMQLDPFERVALIESESVLTPIERTEWFAGANDRYTVLRITSRTPHPKGPVSELFLGGAPNGFIIRDKLNDRPAPPGGGP